MVQCAISVHPFTLPSSHSVTFPLKLTFFADTFPALAEKLVSLPHIRPSITSWLSQFERVPPCWLPNPA
jgi:hypothetical protein